MKKEVRIIFVIGFSLFAMFFGAGNSIFPTFLGYNSGSYWPIAFIFVYGCRWAFSNDITLLCIFFRWYYRIL